MNTIIEDNDSTTFVHRERIAETYGTETFKVYIPIGDARMVTREMVAASGLCHINTIMEASFKYVCRKSRNGVTGRYALCVIKIDKMN